MHNINVIFRQERVVSVNGNFANPLVDHQHVQKISAKGNLRYEVEQFGVHDEVDEAPYSQDRRQDAQRQAHDEEGFRVS